MTSHSVPAYEGHKQGVMTTTYICTGISEVMSVCVPHRTTSPTSSIVHPEDGRDPQNPPVRVPAERRPGTQDPSHSTRFLLPIPHPCPPIAPACHATASRHSTRILLPIPHPCPAIAPVCHATASRLPRTVCADAVSFLATRWRSAGCARAAYASSTRALMVRFRLPSFWNMSALLSSRDGKPISSRSSRA